jgi:hypothetical protein
MCRFGRVYITEEGLKSGKTHEYRPPLPYSFQDLGVLNSDDMEEAMC